MKRVISPSKFLYLNKRTSVILRMHIFGCWCIKNSIMPPLRCRVYRESQISFQRENNKSRIVMELSYNHASHQYNGFVYKRIVAEIQILRNGRAIRSNISPELTLRRNRELSHYEPPPEMILTFNSNVEVLRPHSTSAAIINTTGASWDPKDASQTSWESWARKVKSGT